MDGWIDGASIEDFPHASVSLPQPLSFSHFTITFSLLLSQTALKKVSDSPPRRCMAMNPMTNGPAKIATIIRLLKTFFPCPANVTRKMRKKWQRTEF